MALPAGRPALSDAPHGFPDAVAFVAVSVGGVSVFPVRPASGFGDVAVARQQRDHVVPGAPLHSADAVAGRGNGHGALRCVAAAGAAVTAPVWKSAWSRLVAAKSSLGNVPGADWWSLLGPIHQVAVPAHDMWNSRRTARTSATAISIASSSETSEFRDAFTSSHRPTSAR